ncbi:MAG: LysR family transcriptional regulator [Shimia sp.]|nr:LysR family transcriptional regulator [Shimia sp.]
MDVRWLEDFLALAKLRNFTRAAEFRNVSQAAFSRRIQSLEQWLGTAVVVKGASPVRLTEAGEQFLESAQIAVDRLIEARSSIKSDQFEVMSQVRIAMPNVLARSELKRLLQILKSKHKSSFSVIVGATGEVVGRYLAGDADILFAHDCPVLPAHAALEQHRRLVLRQDRFRPYAASGKDFGFPGTSQAPMPLVAYAQRAYFARLFELLIERNQQSLSYKVNVQCEMSDVLMEVIAAGHGVGWLPQSAVETAGQTRLDPLGGAEWQLDLDICAYRPNAAMDPKIERIWQSLVTDHAEDKVSTSDR